MKKLNGGVLVTIEDIKTLTHFIKNDPQKKISYIYAFIKDIIRMLKNDYNEKTKRELELENAIKSALKIRDLWFQDYWCENKYSNPTEYQALGSMKNMFEKLVEEK